MIGTPSRKGNCKEKATAVYLRAEAIRKRLEPVSAQSDLLAMDGWIRGEQIHLGGVKLRKKTTGDKHLF